MYSMSGHSHAKTIKHPDDAVKNTDNNFPVKDCIDVIYYVIYNTGHASTQIQA